MSDIKTLVWLVGAGPGDAGLFTLRGREVLENAEVVVYDRLVGVGVLAFMPENAEKIDVGKSGGNHPVPQREIENILVKYAKLGKRVVRLKGGDPFVFGRGGEEVEALIKAGINYEIVPGVTSAVAAPAYAGIPVTHRNAASSLHIITAHAKAGGENQKGGSAVPDLNFNALASLNNATLVFLMGVETSRAVCEKLIEAGKDKNTPAAVIERGTTAKQRSIVSNLENLPSEIIKNNVKSPAIILVGEVADLCDESNSSSSTSQRTALKDWLWREILPLNGVKIAVTRPKKRAGKLSRMLRDCGAEVLEIPCIETEIIKNENFKNLNFSKYNWLGFTSITGVEALFNLLAENARDIRELSGVKIAAIGKSTADALRERGLKVDFMPEIYDGENLVSGLVKIINKNEKLLMLRAEAGSRELNKILEQNNIDFTEIAVYKTHYIKSEIPDDLDMAVFTSASTVKAFVECVDINNNKNYKNIKAVCIGAQTAHEAVNAGFEKIYTAEKATLDELVNAAIKAKKAERG